MTMALAELIGVVIVLAGLGWLTANQATSKPRDAKLIKTMGWGAIAVITAGYLWLAPSTGIRNTKPALIAVGDQVFAVKVADTPEARRQGLMGVPSLGGQQGMLFVWNQPGHQKMWMKGMKIPLDILFFNPNKVLVGMTTKAAVCPASVANCPVYDGLSQNTKYVLEIKAGVSDRANFVVGQTKLQTLRQ